VFLPQFSRKISPCFQKDYKDKNFYFEASTENLEHTMVMKEYLWDILSFLMKNNIPKKLGNNSPT
ncbi:MAG: hypothetical protein K2M46_02100, partial [Lachnospiraceae bacterium]|nr:hypothetical protein [Lachnospiraceae bacterium]